MKRKIVLEGDVQQIGFREYIKKFAMNNKIKGSVRNDDDGSVEIYLIIEDNLVGIFEKYVRDPDSKAGVEKITIFTESDKEFGTPPCDFTKFKVIRDDDEVAETLSIMTRTGMGLKEEFTVLGQKVD
ncbi:acylphosphatase, partial [mine drainage metagenome]